MTGVSSLFAADLIRIARAATVRRLRRRHPRALLVGADPSEVALWGFGGLLLGAAVAAASGSTGLALAALLVAGALLGALVVGAVTVDDAARRVVAAAERQVPPPAAFDLVDHLEPHEIATLAVSGMDRRA